MKKNTALSSILLASLLAFACAQTSGGEDPTPSGDGDGDGDSATTTGGSTATGGTSGTGAGTSTGGTVVVITTGGTTGDGDGDGDGDTGGTGGMVGSDCMDGDTVDCADEFPDFPFGTANCTSGAWDVSACLVCEPDQPVPCSVADPTLPNGNVTCASDGLGYVEDPTTVCAACVLDSTTSCEDPGNLTLNRAGEATCKAGGYDWSECLFCENGDTLACADVPGNTTLLFGDATCDESANMGVGDWDLTPCGVCNSAGSTVMDGGQIECVNLPAPARTYTGGLADCNGAGDGYDESNCEYCGDDIISDGEACDGSASAPSVICTDLGLPEGDSGGATLACDNATCQWDVSVCSACDAGYTGDKCIEDGGCSDSADCNNSQCGSLQSCTFTCGGYGVDCTAMSCNTGATCDFQCVGNASCEFDCEDGSTCSNAAPHQAAVDMSCGDGATCDVTCGGNTTCAVDCATGSNCSINGNANASQLSGTANCASGTCDYVFNSGRQVNNVAFTCEDGATCNFSHSSYNYGITGITCESGSTCNITCPGGGGAQCTYTCEAGATCSCSNGGNGAACNCTGPGCP